MVSDRPNAQQAADDLLEDFDRLKEGLAGLTGPAYQKVAEQLRQLSANIEASRIARDPIKDPGASFEPFDPKTVGQLVALALLSQDRVPLARIARSYGSGVYAIYYTGDHPLYAAVSGTETPLYVGKADPILNDASTPREQGIQLFNRLSDHRRMIRQVGQYAVDKQLPHPLDIHDFECRRLVCATNTQLVAERHLINMFKPVWNAEVKIAYGISKHGDSTKVRNNKRSPWDVIHPGRPWALESKEDQMPLVMIVDKINAHFAEHKIYRPAAGTSITEEMLSESDLSREILAKFKQLAPMTSEVEAELQDKAKELKKLKKPKQES